MYGSVCGILSLVVDGGQFKVTSLRNCYTCVQELVSVAVIMSDRSNKNNHKLAENCYQRLLSTHFGFELPSYVSLTIQCLHISSN